MTPGRQMIPLPDTRRPPCTATTDLPHCPATDENCEESASHSECTAVMKNLLIQLEGEYAPHDGRVTSAKWAGTQLEEVPVICSNTPGISVGTMPIMET